MYCAENAEKPQRNTFSQYCCCHKSMPGIGGCCLSRLSHWRSSRNSASLFVLNITAPESFENNSSRKFLVKHAGAVFLVWFCVDAEPVSLRNILLQRRLQRRRYLRSLSVREQCCHLRQSHRQSRCR